MRIRKKEPSVGVLGKIVNSFSSSKQDTYSADFINNKIDPLQETVNKIPMKVLSTGTNIDDIKENGKFAVFNATGTLPPGYSTTDNNIFIDCYMWYTAYGRQIFRDVRTNKTFQRTLSNGIWQKWAAEDIYSKEETFTGKYWIDGKKIYRKVINTGDISGISVLTINHNITNLNSLIDFKFYLYSGYFQSWYAQWDNQLKNRMVYSSGVLEINFSQALDNITKSHIILEYTKTTE